MRAGYQGKRLAVKSGYQVRRLARKCVYKKRARPGYREREKL